MLSLFIHVRLCDPMDCSPPGSSVHGIFQEEHWSGLPFPPSGDLPHPGIEPVSPTLAGMFFTTEPPGKPVSNLQIVLKDCCSGQDKRGSSPQRTNTKVLAPPGDFRELHCSSKFHPEGTGKGALPISGERECVVPERPQAAPSPFLPSSLPLFPQVLGYLCSLLVFPLKFVLYWIYHVYFPSPLVSF